MQTPNELTGFAAMIALVLLAYLMRGAVPRGSFGQVRWLSLCIRFVSIAALLRMVQWDVVIPLLLVYDESLRPFLRDLGNIGNSVFNLLLICAAYCGGRAALALLPDEERGQWDIFNIWFYPRHLWRKWGDE